MFCVSDLMHSAHMVAVEMSQCHVVKIGGPDFKFMQLFIYGITGRQIALIHGIQYMPQLCNLSFLVNAPLSDLSFGSSRYPQEFSLSDARYKKPIQASTPIYPWAHRFLPLSASRHYRYQTANKAKYEPPRNATHVFLSSPYPHNKFPPPKVVAPQPIYKLRPILSLKAPAILPCFPMSSILILNTHYMTA